MRFIFAVILTLVALKCGKAMHIEFRDNSSWGFMWLALSAGTLIGAIALLQH